MAAGVAASLLGAAAGLGEAAQRSAAFALGPAALLVTLHARTAGYLHDDGLAATETSSNQGCFSSNETNRWPTIPVAPTLDKSRKRKHR